MMTKQPLPKGWHWAKLGDVCEQDRRIIEPKAKIASQLPYLGLEYIESNTGRILREPEEPVNKEEGKSTSFAFDSRHILYGKLRPYLNKVALPEFEGRCTTELIPLLPKQTDRKFLAWLLRRSETVSAAMQGKTGSRMPRANMDELLNLSVPLPPLEEQKRIAARLDEQMRHIEQARLAAEESLSAAWELPSAYLRDVFEGKEAKKWQVQRLAEISEIISGITLGRKLGEVKTRKVPYLRVANVKDGHLDLSDIKEIDATDNDVKKCLLKYGDLLLTEGGDPDKLGRGTFWEEQIPECLHQNHIFRVRFDLNKFSPQFAAYQFGSAYGKDYFLAHAKQTTGIATINQKVLGNFPFLIPPFEEQKQIAKAIKAKIDEANVLITHLESQLAEIEALPSAVLGQAFAGGV